MAAVKSVRAGRSLTVGGNRPIVGETSSMLRVPASRRALYGWNPSVEAVCETPRDQEVQ